MAYYDTKLRVAEFLTGDVAGDGFDLLALTTQD